MVFDIMVKQCFVNRLTEHNIIVVSRQYRKPCASFEHKIIGMKDGLRWDFTPLLADLTGCNTNGNPFDVLAVRGFARQIIKTALEKLSQEKEIIVPPGVLENPRDFYGQFFM